MLGARLSPWGSGMLLNYLRLLLFGLGLLVGLQLPALVDQYSKRVDAHWREAQQALAGFQANADVHFGGDMQRLVEHYAASSDAVFRADARSIATLLARRELLQAEVSALAANSAARIWHLLWHADAEIRRQMLMQYSYTVPLTPEAIFWALAVGLGLAWLVELPLRLLLALLRGRPPQRSGVYGGLR